MPELELLGHRHRGESCLRVSPTFLHSLFPAAPALAPEECQRALAANYRLRLICSQQKPCSGNKGDSMGFTGGAGAGESNPCEEQEGLSRQPGADSWTWSLTERIPSWNSPSLVTGAPDRGSRSPLCGEDSPGIPGASPRADCWGQHSQRFYRIRGCPPPPPPPSSSSSLPP